MYFPTATYTKQESNAAMVCVGRIAHKDLKCTCFPVQHDGENYFWIKCGIHVHMSILLSLSVVKQDQLTHLVFKTDRYIRFIQRKFFCLCYLPDMIWNNGASLPGKGFHFSKRLLREDLHYHFKRYGRDGSIILLDCKQFFPSASHRVIYARHDRLIHDYDLRKLGDDIVASSTGDKGMPLGVEPSQAEMIAFPSPLDNYIKCQLSIKCAGHYMDDYYIIVPPNQDPKEIMRLIVQKASELDLTISKEKSRIVPLSKPFRYCKAKYTLTESGRVIVTGNRGSFKRTRHKIKAFYEKVQDGEMSYEDLWTSVNGMLAYLEGYQNHQRVLRLRRLFYAIYGFSAENIENFRAMERLKDAIHCT